MTLPYAACPECGRSDFCTCPGSVRGSTSYESNHDRALFPVEPLDELRRAGRRPRRPRPAVVRRRRHRDPRGGPFDPVSTPPGDWPAADSSVPDDPPSPNIPSPDRRPTATRSSAVIIDCHCHAGPGDGLTGPWDTDAPLTAHLRRARAAGIHRTVLFPAFHSDYRRANRFVGQIVRRHPALFYGFAFVHAERDRGRIHALVAEAVGEYGFLGIKVHRHDARMTREICEVAREFRLPILYDVMGEISTVSLLASQYPDVSFLIPHLGSFADDWRAQSAFLDPLARYPNVFTDTSGVRRFDLLVDAVRRAGPGKILFGSDGPWLHPGLELEKVRLLGLRPSAERLVLGGNWLRLTQRSTGSGPIAPRRPPRVPASVGESPPRPADPWLSD